MKDGIQLQDFVFKCFRGAIRDCIMYALDLRTNVIWKVDLLLHTAKVETYINEDCLFENDYFSLCINDSELVLMPKGGRGFAIYDLCNGEMRFVRSEEKESRENYVLPPYFESITNGSDTYCFGAGSESIVRLNTRTGNINVSVVWDRKKYGGSLNNDSMLFFSQGLLFEKSYIYITGGKYRAIFRIDTRENKCEYYPYEDIIDKAHGIINHRDEKWILVNMGDELCFIKWDEARKCTDRISIGNENHNIQWWNPLGLGGYYYIFPTNGIHVYKVNIEKKEVYLINDITPILEDMPDGLGKFCVRLMGDYDNKILFLTNWNYKYHEFNTLTGRIESFYIKIDDLDYMHRYWQSWREGIDKKDGFVKEEDMQLIRFVEMIVDS